MIAAMRLLHSPPVDYGLVVVPEGTLEFGQFTFGGDAGVVTSVRMTERTLTALVKGKEVHLVSSVV